MQNEVGENGKTSEVLNKYFLNVITRENTKIRMSDKGFLSNLPRVSLGFLREELSVIHMTSRTTDAEMGQLEHGVLGRLIIGTWSRLGGTRNAPHSLELPGPFPERRPSK